MAPDSELDRDTGQWTHLDESGAAHMVDVSGKPWTFRRALARCQVTIDPRPRLPEDATVHGAEGLPDALGALFATARVAGVQASKKTAGLIPLCHPLTGSGVDVRIAAVPEGISIEAEATTIGPTGVEMEALTACTFAALSAISVLRDTEQRVSIDDLTLWEKSGGRSGAWMRAT